MSTFPCCQGLWHGLALIIRHSNQKFTVGVGFPTFGTALSCLNETSFFICMLNLYVCLTGCLPACRMCYTHWRCAVVWRVFYHFPSAIFLTFFIVNIFKCNLNRRYIISWIFELIALRSVLKVIFKCTNLLKVKNFIRLCARIFFKWFSHKNCYQCLILML